MTFDAYPGEHYTTQFQAAPYVLSWAYANISIQSVGVSIIQIPTGCTTTAAMDFPLDFDGPVCALGGGTLTFNGTTSFPSLGGCGLYGPWLSALMSGAGQKFSYTVAPPAPVNW